MNTQHANGAVLETLRAAPPAMPIPTSSLL